MLACTWNLDAAKPVDLTSTSENASFLTSVLTSEASPDIIVFSFQELIDLDDKKLTASECSFLRSTRAGTGPDEPLLFNRDRPLWKG